LMCNFIFYVILLEMELLSLCIVVFKIEWQIYLLNHLS
jgi:hypothetical protein